MAAEPELLLTGMDSQRDAAIQRDRALLLRAIDGKAWDAYRALLGKSVKAALIRQGQRPGANRYDAIWNEPVLYQALLRWKTLGCFSEAAISQLVTDSYNSPMFKWLLNSSAAMEELLLTIDLKDDGGKVLKLLIDVWSMNEKKYEKYFPLAVACAVVFDRPMSIPNPVGKASDSADTEVDPLKRYMWYVDNNERGKLAAPVHHTSARDLVWVVCAPVSTSELDWSIDKMQRHRKNWGDAYGMIEYLMERAVEGLNPYKEYSFAEILKEGGVCGDQAYFCVNTARAQGIPAMIIGGETDSGGHAWAGLKIKDDEWTTGVGRIGGASKGQSGNPQTGETISKATWSPAPCGGTCGWRTISPLRATPPIMRLPSGLLTNSAIRSPPLGRRCMSCWNGRRSSPAHRPSPRISTTGRLSRLRCVANSGTTRGWRTSPPPPKTSISSPTAMARRPAARSGSSGARSSARPANKRISSPPPSNGRPT
jgi:hypothetical protein